MQYTIHSTLSLRKINILSIHSLWYIYVVHLLLYPLCIPNPLDMSTYLLKSKSQANLNKYGTAKEIWQHTTEQGYSGETQVVDGYPLPDGEDISLAKGSVKKAGALRMQIEYWQLIDEFKGGKARLKSQADVVGYGLQALQIARDFGPVYATTPEGIKKFDSVIEFMILKPYFETVGFVPVICADEGKLEGLE